MEPKTIESKAAKGISLPVAIIIAGALIAGGVYLGTSKDRAVNQQQFQQPVEQPLNLDAMDPVTSEDHIRGDINADVTIVEYSDTECPFCKRFQETLQQIMRDYGSKGTVAWVYRHYPLDQLHPKARKEAEATECAAELGGNDGFWTYLDRLMKITPANNGLDPAELPRIAEYAGLDVAAFNACLSSGKYAEKIERHVQNAMATGGQGTPWSIVIGKDGKKYPLSGAQPYDVVEQVIEAALWGE